MILLDMTIPGASSHEVIAEAVQSRPDIRVLLTSAYSLEMLTPPWRPQISGFIASHINSRDLMQILRKISSS